MFKRMIYRLGAIALFLFGVLFAIPSQAQAAATVSLDGTNDIVNVVTVYPTTPDTQPKVLSEIAKEEQTAFSNIPGFQDSALLKAENGSQVIALSQWKGKDLSTFQAYASEHILDVATNGKPQSFACQVQQTETRDKSPSLQQGNVIQFSQFKMKPGKNQSELAMVVSQMMPGVLQMASGLQWAAMCPSTDKSTIALLARWNSADDFKSLSQQPGFDKETNYWQDYANNEHGLYDVAQVIR
ncbi:hypothetical protein ACQ4M3_29860 [Leptolyngbya sp. AN03gr2]|uniref:hypothetical protein n=1 Tax=unclassified Leptolyngbya TaxID=2650499 RepID=UPI003D31B4FE